MKRWTIFCFLFSVVVLSCLAAEARWRPLRGAARVVSAPVRLVRRARPLRILRAPVRAVRAIRGRRVVLRGGC